MDFSFKLNHGASTRISDLSVISDSFFLRKSSGEQLVDTTKGVLIFLFKLQPLTLQYHLATNYAAGPGH